MIIHQILPTLAYGDAVSNEVLSMQKILRQAGHQSEIYALNLDERVKNLARKFNGQIAQINKADQIIYHFSIGSPILDEVVRLEHPRLIMRYHNITPGKFFALVAPSFKKEVDVGRLQLERSLNRFSTIWADSLYNQADLVAMGFAEEKIAVMPILMDYEQYNQPPDGEQFRKLHDGRTNILFVGRIAPNKCHEDLIKATYYYGKYFNPDCRLILAGSQQFPVYTEMLANLVRELGMGDTVYFTGHISFAQLLACYKASHVFLSMSEHEGFCVPVIESMYFHLPVIAYRSSALPETIGDAGLLLDSKDPRIAAAAIDRVITDPILQEDLLANQIDHLKPYAMAAVQARFIGQLQKLGD